MTVQPQPTPVAPPAAVGFRRRAPGKVQRVIPWSIAVIAIAQLGLGAGGSFSQPWWSLLWSLSLVLAIGQVVVARRTGTEVTATGLRVYNGLPGKRWSWAQFAGLTLPGRFEGSCTAVLLDGRRIVLYGLPAEAGQTLVDAGAVRLEGGTTGTRN